MRIRTLKPEFWMHEGLAKCSEFSRLLAIALLNWADDEGYFMANPILIRGQVFPFEDNSEKVQRSLKDLSRVGWIRLGKDNQQRAVGVVINFPKHQRVDKPKPSTIKPLAIFQDESKNDPRTITDESQEEGKGREGKGRDLLSEKSDDMEIAESIYEQYPRKEGRKKGIEAIIKAMKKNKPEFLLERTTAYASAIGWKETQFIPLPATWFNGERFKDEESAWQPPIKRSETSVSQMGLSGISTAEMSI